MIVGRSYARAGLLGNPSDGYGGKTLSLTLREYRAEVALVPSERLTFVPGREDREVFSSWRDFEESTSRYGMYGGLRLLKAALKQLLDYARDRLEIPDRNFSAHWNSDIPRGVGLAGSSAIVTAALKALNQFWKLDIPAEVLATVAWRAEKDTLGIPAGPQDRVIQMLEGIWFMDFSGAAMTLRNGVETGSYQQLACDWDPRLYISYDSQGGEPTEVFHSQLGARFRAGDSEVVAAMKTFAQLAEQGRDAWLARDGETLGTLINANFDLRQSLVNLPAWQVRMVEVARGTGATAKFCGSGGAIVGTYRDKAHFRRLESALAEIGCTTFIPEIP